MKTFEVKLWVYVDAEKKSDVFVMMDEVLGHQVRNYNNFLSFGVDDVIEQEEEK